MKSASFSTFRGAIVLLLATGIAALKLTPAPVFVAGQPTLRSDFKSETGLVQVQRGAKVDLQDPLAIIHIRYQC